MYRHMKIENSKGSQEIIDNYNYIWTTLHLEIGEMDKTFHSNV